jgi:parvulin-like peptidyl-prolyl isomerase
VTFQGLISKERSALNSLLKSLEQTLQPLPTAVNLTQRPSFVKGMTTLSMLLMLTMLSACGGTANTPSLGNTQIAATPANSDVPANTTTTENAPAATTSETSLSAEGLPVNEAGEPLVARVNGVGITQEEFDRALARSQQVGAIAADPNALSQTVLDILIEQEVIEQAAEEMDITITDAEIEADVQNMVTQAGSTEAWQQWMSDNLYTDEEYREAARSQFITLRVRDQVIADNYTSAEGESGGVRQVHARHILVSTEAEARDILQRLQNGESFEGLALQFSRDVTTRERGGDLGFFIRENLTTPELADAAFALQPGEVTGPIQTALGYHVLQTLEFGTGSGTVANEDVARQQETVFNTWLQSEMASAQIERYVP